MTDVVTAVLGIRIKLPPEAMIPLLIGTAALLVLLFAGSALQRWKQSHPAVAAKFGLVLGVILTGASIYFLSRCLLNQSDPNNEGTGQLSFTDPPIAGFMAALAASFWKFGEQRKVALGLGLVIGGLMLIKPFVWPVIVTYTESYGGRGTVIRSRGMMDPEHLEFLATGIVVVITALVAGAKRTPPAAPYPPWPQQQPPYAG